MPGDPFHVVATAGHVDHGKSALIVRLTGIDPDRWSEEKRRGLTIDLGYAWCTLPSGREIAFVDVPGHERFVHNMLAGVGPVREVLFVVAADEGWRRQSEEHLEILELLGARGVIAVSKADLVDEEGLALVRTDVAEHVAGTVLAEAPVVVCSAETGAGLDELRTALDALTSDGRPLPRPVEDRPRLDVDRVFTIAGAGTIVTGTLTGGSLAIGDEIEVLPAGRRARIRGLQSHERAIEHARPVARVAVNLAGVERDELRRGDVLAHPGSFAVGRVVDVRLTPARSLGHPITARGAFKVHAGAAEIDARIRLLGTTRLDPGDEAYARLHLASPHAFDPFDRVVVRESGRRETVAGGRVLDPEPAPGSTAATIERLRRRDEADPERLPELLVRERGAIRASDASRLTGGASRGIDGTWLIDDELREAVRSAVVDHLAGFHLAHPLREGDAIGEVRALVQRAARERGGPDDADLAQVLLDGMTSDGTIVRSATSVRLSSHAVAVDDTDPRLERLLAAVGSRPERPPSVKELVADGIPPELIDAAVGAGALIRVSNDLVFLPGFVDEAIRVARTSSEGVSVSGFRERLGTTRKYAVPLLEHLDRTGVTRREGDLRFPREPER